MSRGKVLVVEDDLDIRSLEVMLLTDEGYEVFEAANGEEALDFIKNNPEQARALGCMLVDIMMPKLNGIEFIKIIRSPDFSDPKIADIPVLVTSADANIEAKVGKGKNIGWIAKPVDLEALLAAVASYFQE